MSSDCLPTQLYVVAMLGAMKAGAAYLPLVNGQEATSARYCRAARPGLVLVEDGAATGELSSLEARVVTSSELRAVLRLGRDMPCLGHPVQPFADDPECAERDDAMNTGTALGQNTYPACPPVRSCAFLAC